MSESMQVTPQSSVGASQSKLSSMGTGNNSSSSEETASFDDALTNYSEAESDVTAQKAGNTVTDLDESVPQVLPENGNTLPLDENAALWQALLLLQPAENSVTNSTSPNLTTAQMQSAGLLEGHRQPALIEGHRQSVLKPVLTPQLGNQDYFNTMLTQNKDIPATMPAGLVANNPNIQLSAVHFNPESKEALLLNISEQFLPAQGVNSTTSQGIAAVGFGTAIQAATTQTQMAPLNLGQNAWESNLGSKLQMLIGQNVQTAEIRLDPPELGALDIKIKVVNEVATVNITSPHAQVREALETAVPRLREMFEESGVALGDVNVRQESFAQQEHATQEEAGVLVSANDSGFIEEEAIPVQKIVSNNLLDLYA